jgi:hypothetical protein
MDPSTPLQPYIPPQPVGQPIPSGQQNMPMPGQPAAFPQTSPPTVQSAASMLPNQPFSPPPPLGTPQLMQTPYNASEANIDSSAVAASNGNAKQELINHLKKANNVLVTVSSNPSVDQLSAAIGLTVVLNKLNKHATAVYSGETPSTIEFLSPEKTLEKNTDSLRDFIIALDKAKADKLRYKVEDKFVKIFITPYHTSINEEDLEFSQGDFNVDVIVALGVQKREELDQAITAHGRILHDAVTISVNNTQKSEIGAVNWFQPDASSLCEMIVGLIEPLQGDKALLDTQTATAFLTGVVAETERFSNSKTTPLTMNVSAILMKAGANQQLVASKLEAPKPIPQADKTFDSKKMDELASEPSANAVPTAIPTPNKDGSLEIKHKEDAPSPSKTLQELEKENKSGDSDSDMGDDNLAKIHIDDQGKLLPADQVQSMPQEPPVPSNMIMNPPTMGTATPPDTNSNVVSEVAPVAPQPEISEHTKTINPLTEAEKAQTLDQIEQSVNSKHIEQSASPPVAVLNPQAVAMSPEEQVARNAVEQAANADISEHLEPINALNAQPIDLGSDSQENSRPQGSEGQTNEQVFPPQLIGPDKGPAPDPTAGPSEPSAPPLVPPPLMPPPSN